MTSADQNAYDLFGGRGRAPRASLRPLPAPVGLDLFAAAAEARAYASGRPLSQERAELVAGDGLRCLCDAPLLSARADCTECGR